MKPIVVLGSGLAGYTLVRELRKLDRDTEIILISRDSGDYYSKPMLSNAFAQGKDAATLVNTAAAEMAKQLNFTLLPHTEVLGIDRERKQLRTSAGVIEYGRLVLALGADAIRLPLQGDAADAVMSVNDLADYAKFRGAITSVKQIAIIGAGLIGCEFANDLAAAGYAVTVIDPTAYPLSGLMPEEAGTQLLAPLVNLGVAFHFGVAVKAVDRNSSAYALTLTNESVLHADIVLSAVGLRPRIELARNAGLAVNRGIVVDAQLRSSDADIFALGDCAEIEGRVLPYVLPIMHAARALARVLAGEDARVEFPAMPVVIKTPAHPVAVLPVARNALGAWQMLANGHGVKLGFFDAQNQLSGFVLTGEYAVERGAMTKQLGLPGFHPAD
ncbi:MAG: FAD-dependent oxidoreductase [Gallionella sp.]